MIAIGLAIIAIGWSYPFGSLTQMGPGFLPHYLGVGIVALGVAVTVMDMRSPNGEAPGQIQWRALLLICAAVILFAVLVNWAGLVPAMFLAVSVSMLADPAARPLEILGYSLVMTVLGWLLFIQALGLPLSAFWR